jgi:D-serine deaminase-like pyridoxal phosphate-dependent protein
VSRSAKPFIASSPARAGDNVADVDTPALIVELDRFERNVALMADAVRGRNVRLRPHAKSHKCPEIAKRQLAAGAIGICCQKVSEAEAFVASGIDDVLVTNEIVGEAKLARLAALARKARIGVLADNQSNVVALGAAASKAGIALDVLVEVDVGAHRCGVEPGAAALELARAVVAQERLRFGGLHAYHGAAQHLRLPDERRAAIGRAIAWASETKALIERDGIACPTITGAGTGTFTIERDSGVYNELQPGSYVFMDADYGRNETAANDVAFAQSLFVWTTVMSRPSADRAIVDAGLKAFAVDSGMPVVESRPELECVKASDEHGALLIRSGETGPALGEKLKLVPGHCDPTVNLYDWLIVVRDGRVEDVWPVAARGALL